MNHKFKIQNSKFNITPRGVHLAALLLACLPGLAAARAADEHIRGVLEKTVKPGACAQITDALKEIYYVVKNDEAEKACAELMGKRVVLTGVVEQRQGDAAYFLSLRKAEPYQPKLPEAPQPGDSPSSPSLPLPPHGKNTPPAPGVEAPKPGAEKTGAKTAGEAEPAAGSKTR